MTEEKKVEVEVEVSEAVRLAKLLLKSKLSAEGPVTFWMNDNSYLEVRADNNRLVSVVSYGVYAPYAGGPLYSELEMKAAMKAAMTAALS